jgi:hypothetical protein
MRELREESLEGMAYYDMSWLLVRIMCEGQEGYVL